MTDAAAVATVARALGDESRAGMCLAMLDGMAWTVSELATVARVSVSTASEHLTRLVQVGLVTESRQGRFRYVQLASAEVAEALEQLTSLTQPAAPTSLRGVSERRRLAAARTCYDHLAGRLGVTVLDAFVSSGTVRSSGGLALTRSGRAWFAEQHIDVDALESQRRPLVRECLDWTERRPHLAGSLGAAVCTLFVEREWVRRTTGSRALAVTPLGQRGMRDVLGIDPSALR